MRTDSDPSDPESDVDGAGHWQHGSPVNERLREPAATLVGAVGGIDSMALLSDDDDHHLDGNDDDDLLGLVRIARTPMLPAHVALTAVVTHG